MAERDPVIHVVIDCPVCGEDRSAAMTKEMFDRGAEAGEVFVGARQVAPSNNYRGPVAPLHLVHATHLN